MPTTTTTAPDLEAAKLYHALLKARRQLAAAVDHLTQATDEEATLRAHVAAVEADYRAAKEGAI